MLEIISEPSVIFGVRSPRNYEAQQKRNTIDKRRFDVFSISSKNLSVFQEKYLPRAYICIRAAIVSKSKQTCASITP